MTRSRRPLLLAALALVAPSALHAQQSLTEADEIALARSAGPPDISAHADVYVLRKDRFVRVVEGTNGFSCLVVREAADPDVLAPHCLDPLATETVLPAFDLEARLHADGLSADEIQDRVTDAFQRGDLALPSGPAYAYMLSSGQHLGQAGKWKPHFMMYVPYLTNEDVGGNPRTPQFPFVGPRENHPLSTLVIVMTEFVDPVTPDTSR